MSLLAIEWMKIKRYRTFWIIVGLYALIFLGWNIQIATGVLNFGPQLIGAFSFPAVWDNLGWWGSLFILLLAILVITITTNEFSFRTHRQNVIDGWSRSQFFHAKVLLVLALSIGTSIFVMLTGLGFGYTYMSGNKSMLEGIEHMGFFFVLTLNYLGAAMLLGLLVRRSGLAIGLFLLYALFLETILKFTLNHYTDSHIGSFFPLQASDELLPLPLLRLAPKGTGGAPLVYTNNPAFVMASLAWIALYYFVGRRIVLTKDL